MSAQHDFALLEDIASSNLVVCTIVNHIHPLQYPRTKFQHFHKPCPLDLASSKIFLHMFLADFQQCRWKNTPINLTLKFCA